jgi:hypothetical protein
VLHSLLITAHAACATAALALGLAATLRRTEPIFGAYLATLSLMLLFLVLLVVIDWAGLDDARRGTFAALLMLAAYTAWRGWHATRAVSTGGFIDDVGFTLIALFDGFVIVSAIDIGIPLWMIPAVGILGVLLGILGVHWLKRRAVNEAPTLSGAQP